MILPMVQAELLGPMALLPEALALLQRAGAMELRTPAAADERGAPLAAPRPLAAEDAGRAGRLEEALRRLEPVGDRLAAAAAGAVSSPAAPDVPVLPPPADPAFPAALDALAARLDALEAGRAALLEERERIEAFSRLVVAVAPLRHGLDPALEPELHGLVLRRDPAALALLAAEARRLTGDRCEVQARDLDEGHVGVLVVVPRASGPALTSLLFERGVDEVKLPATVAGHGLLDGLLAVAARQRALPDEIARADAAVLGLAAAAAPAVEAARAAGRAELERLRAEAGCGATRFAFVVAGWLPEERLPALEAALAAAFGGKVALLARRPAPARWPEVPVVLRNRPALRPFERLLGLVPLPRYGSIDPTPFLAVGFPLFFGLVLGDLAFGAAGAALALVARARGWGGRLGRDLAWVALACSVAAALFGLLFGEALGELGAHAGLHPLFDRRRGLMAFLALALALGLLHLLVGAALGVVSAARGRHRREAVARGGQLVALAAGALALATRLVALPPAVAPAALGAAGAGLLAAVAAEGPMAALHLVLGFGHVLSYARLMALGLASAMLAEVANGLAAALPGLPGLALAALLHAVNFSLCLVSPIVAALRLHYVEFFERFYDEGGRPFRPFALSS